MLFRSYIQAGFMSPRQGRRALDFPDLDAIESLANAQEDVITKTLDNMVERGEYEPPEPTDDLGMAKEMVVEYIQRYRCADLEQDRLELLRRYSMQVDEMMMQAAAAATAPPVPAGVPGGAVPGDAGVAPGQGPLGAQALPMAPPRSDLLPNAPH